MLNEVADGVWVRQSEWVWSNAVVVRGDDGFVPVDPAPTGPTLTSPPMTWPLGLPVVAGFSTHCHWDHLLWHPRFGDVPRYATAANARAAGELLRERAQEMAARSASGIPLELIGSSPRCPPTADRSPASSSGMRRTRSATRQSCWPTVES